MKIIISGASGFVGKRLVAFLKEWGYHPYILVRDKSLSGPHAIYWNPRDREIDASRLENFDAVINLSGENIASSRWTNKQKQTLRASRIKTTQLLSKTLAGLKYPPQILINASAVGYYGSHGDDILDEKAVPASDFLGQLCQDWESATVAAVRKGIRVVYARFGVILDPSGGALRKMLLPFKLGLGGVIGSGKQYMPWITLDDSIHALHHILKTSNLHGPVNIVAPNPVTNQDYTKALGRCLRRPTIFPLPAFIARFILGEMADALLLSSQRVQPQVLLDSDFSFQHPKIEDALSAILTK
jgi:uncharacterized protein (TIGR01777 family)